MPRLSADLDLTLGLLRRVHRRIGVEVEPCAARLHGDEIVDHRAGLFVLRQCHPPAVGQRLRVALQRVAAYVHVVLGVTQGSRGDGLARDVGQLTIGLEVGDGREDSQNEAEDDGSEAEAVGSTAGRATGVVLVLGPDVQHDDDQAADQVHVPVVAHAVPELAHVDRREHCVPFPRKRVECSRHRPGPVMSKNWLPTLYNI